MSEASPAAATESETRNQIVLHIAGVDRPGVTSRLTQVIAEEHAALISIGQSVLQGYLMLSAIVEIPVESHALRRLLFEVAELGLRLEVSAIGTRGRRQPSTEAGLSITLIGAELGKGAALAQVTQFLAERQINIDHIRTLSEGELEGIELAADLPAGEPSPTELNDIRGEILALAGSLSVDIAVQRNDMFRRLKRLVCLDVDSTFAQGEFIDELAELAGCKPQVAEITARAMRGELDFKEALRERVALLEGLPFEKALGLAERVELTPGAERFARALKALGFRVGLVSGGFDFFVDHLKKRCGLDFAFANELEVLDGRLTGRVKGTIVDGERKAQILRDMCQVYKCRTEQSVAIGDGANDILMLQRAGLGIAFRGKPRLQEIADMSLNHNGRMDVLLYLMGFNAKDIAQLDRLP